MTQTQTLIIPTFRQLAKYLGISLRDWCEEAETFADDKIFHCFMIDDLIAEGLVRPDLTIIIEG